MSAVLCSVTGMATAATPLHTVLIPGLLCSARLYEHVLPAVWSYGGVTIADTRRDSTVTAMAQRLLAVAPDQFVLSGLSMGGYVALEVMRLAPERVTGLALISTSARPDSPEQVASRREQAQAVAAGRFDELVDAVYPVLVDAGNIARTDLADSWKEMAHEIGPDAFVAQLTAAMARPDSRPNLAAIRCPTAVVHGTGDRLITPEKRDRRRHLGRQAHSRRWRRTHDRAGGTERGGGCHRGNARSGDSIGSMLLLAFWLCTPAAHRDSCGWYIYPPPMPRAVATKPGSRLRQHRWWQGRSPHRAIGAPMAP